MSNHPAKPVRHTPPPAVAEAIERMICDVEDHAVGREPEVQRVLAWVRVRLAEIQELAAPAPLSRPSPDHSRSLNLN